MQVEGWTFVLQTVNFAVLVWLLHRFLYKPLLAVIAARRTEIDKQYAQAAEKEAQVNAQLAGVAAERSQVERERETFLKAAAIQAEEAAAARRARAERDAAALIEAAHKSIAAERVAALADARQVALDIGSDIARKLLSEMPTKLRAEAWLDRVEQHLAARSPPERESLVRQSSNGSVRIVAAMPIPQDSAEAFRKRLGQILGETVRIEFATDPELIAGVELHFPNAVLRFTWQSALSALRSDSDAPRSSAQRPDQVETLYVDAR